MVSVKFRKNLWSGIIAVLIGIIVLLLIPSQIKTRAVALSAAIPPNYLPTLLSYLMIILGVALVLKSTVFKKDEYVNINIKGELHAFIYFIIIAVYVILMPIIGFLLSSILFCTGALVFMKVKKISYYIFINGITAFLWFAFKFLLKVPLP